MVAPDSSRDHPYSDGVAGGGSGASGDIGGRSARGRDMVGPADRSDSGSGRRRRRRLSPLTLRIMALSIFPIMTMFGGLVYVGGYERSLLEAEVAGLGTQAYVIASALGEIAVPPGLPDEQKLNVIVAKQAMRRLVARTNVRVRLFDSRGNLVADTRRSIRVEALPPPSGRSWATDLVVNVYDWFFSLLSAGREETPPYVEKPEQSALDYAEVQSALLGEPRGYVRRAGEGYLVLTYAMPVQRYKKVFGAIMVSTSSLEADKSVREVRLDLVKIFGVVIVLTLFLSLYLARAIARPINRLASAADAMRRGHNRALTLPDFTSRRDEIGDLSGALGDLTTELWRRMDAIDGFAADVSHEIKNPLSSLRSAVETAARVKDPDQQRKLMDVIQEDVARLDRLITDISRASRLDAELSRDVPAPVNVGRLLETLTEVRRTTADDGRPKLQLDIPRGKPLIALAVEDRLVQVFQNILANAESFSPPHGRIVIRARHVDGFVRVTIDDEGPGIPAENLEDIFTRFYSERPAGEKFGTHSGLGLSISKQIVESLGGAIHAENRPKPGGTDIAGARFVIDVPVNAS